MYKAIDSRLIEMLKGAPFNQGESYQVFIPEGEYLNLEEVEQSVPFEIEWVYM